MNVPLRKPMSLDEFAAWEAAQEWRWEFDGSEPMAMVGGTDAHETICLNVAAELRARLRGGPCKAYASGRKLKTATSIRYPDAFVICQPVQKDTTMAEDAVVIFEVQSASTADIDQFVKPAEYQTLPSLQRYVMLPQDRIAATMLVRHGDDWHFALVRDPAATLHLPEIGVSVPIADLYAGVIDPPAAP